MNVPLHPVNQENSPAVKLSSAIVSHALAEIAVTCLPARPAESVTGGLGNLGAGHSPHRADVTFPEGVTPAKAKENPVVARAQPACASSAVRTTPRHSARRSRASVVPVTAALALAARCTIASRSPGSTKTA